MTPEQQERLDEAFNEYFQSSKNRRLPLNQTHADAWDAGVAAAREVFGR